jgi:excinuclease UvrABC ATPase subunit
VIADRLRIDGRTRHAWPDAVETALRRGHGHLADAPDRSTTGNDGVDRGLALFSSALACADCGIDYADPCRACSRSTRRSAPARPAAASAA